MMCADTWIITVVTKLCGHCCNRSCGDTWCLHSFCCEQKHSDFGHCCNTWSTTVTLLWCSFAARSCDKHTDLLLLTCPGDSVCTCSPCVLLGFYACFALVRPHYLTDIHVSSAGNYTPLNEWPSFRKASVFITWPKRSLVVKVDLVFLTCRHISPGLEVHLHIERVSNNELRRVRSSLWVKTSAC